MCNVPLQASLTALLLTCTQYKVVSYCRCTINQSDQEWEKVLAKLAGHVVKLTSIFIPNLLYIFFTTIRTNIVTNNACSELEVYRILVGNVAQPLSGIRNATTDAVDCIL